MNKDFLDNGQYKKHSIMKYEAVFGKNFISPGGRKIAYQFIKKLKLKKNMIVLDIGSGLGGSALIMCHYFGVKVHCIDLSSNMIRIAKFRLEKEILQKTINLEQGNCLDLIANEKYHVVHSRDTFLHIKEKDQLFEVVKNALISGGRFVFSDYCLGLKIPKHEYKNYLEKRKYNLLSVTDYINLLKKKGFSLVSGEDKTLLFINILKQEIQNLEKSNLKLNEKNEIRLSWLKKLERAELGEQCWGWFYATKNVKS